MSDSSHHNPLAHQVIELELKYMEQADSLEQLSQALYYQQQTIQQLQSEIKSLTLQLENITDSPLKPESQEMPPPHY